MEEIFDEKLEEVPPQSADGRRRLLYLCLTAMVGKFGQTSKEKGQRRWW
jgi:hypothetical protein